MTNLYPYSDFHELNADWLLKKTKEHGIELEEHTTELNTLNDAVQDLESGKVDKEPGKGLSTNDFTDADKDKLDNIEAGAQVNAYGYGRVEAHRADNTTIGWAAGQPNDLFGIKEGNNIFINRDNGDMELNSGIWYATSSTSATDAAKVASTVNGDFVKNPGVRVAVQFDNANSYNGTATLNVDGTGAVSIARIGTNTTTRYYWTAGEIIDFVYDGTYFVMINAGTASTTYYGLTKLSSSVSSTSEALAATPKAVKTVNDSKAPTNHASDQTTYGPGTSANYGHVKLTDTVADTDAASGIAATPKMLYDLLPTLLKINTSKTDVNDTGKGCIALDLNNLCVLWYQHTTTISPDQAWAGSYWGTVSPLDLTTDMGFASGLLDSSKPIMWFVSPEVYNGGVYISPANDGTTTTTPTIYGYRPNTASDVAITLNYLAIAYWAE